MPTEIWIWPKGQYFIDHFLPLQFEPESSREPASGRSAMEAAHAFLDLCSLKGYGNQLSFEEWDIVHDEMGLETTLARAVFNNCRVTQKKIQYAPKTQLALDIALLDLENYFYPRGGESSNRGDVICELLKLKMVGILEILLRATLNLDRTKVKGHVFRRCEQRSFKMFSFLDMIFEGMSDEGGGANEFDDVMEVSLIASTMWTRENSLSLAKLARNLAACLVPDPFSIDDLPILQSPSFPSVLKRTSLGAGARRRVQICGWKRLELLRKGVYREVNLRVFSNQNNASMLIAPWRSLSVILDNLKDCSPIVLGPCRGTVVLRDCHRTTISVNCRTLHVWNCSEVTVFCDSENPTVLRDSTAIQLAPYNAAYSGFSRELQLSTLVLDKTVPSAPISLDESSWSWLKPSSFYVQPLPIETSDSDVQALLSSLPLEYANSWLRWSKSVDDSIEQTKSKSIKNSDILYLRSKINKS